MWAWDKDGGSFTPHGRSDEIIRVIPSNYKGTHYSKSVSSPKRVLATDFDRAQNHMQLNQSKGFQTKTLQSGAI